MGQIVAPAIPDAVAVIDKMAIGTVPIRSSVRAKRIAVPETVAMASERRNQAMRKMTACRSFAATLTVFQRETHAKDVYARQERIRPPEMPVLRGGPGRSLSHSEAGIVKTNHQMPTKRRTTLRARVEETFNFDIKKRMSMLKIWTETAAM
jgi:hypothetical protein